MSEVTGAAQSAEQIRGNYLNLLVTQLRYQNPLDPMKNDQMASQLAQLSQLEQLEYMNRSFEKVLLAERVNQATGLIGKTVSFVPPDSQTALCGPVDGVVVNGDQVQVKIGEWLLNVDEVQTIGVFQ